MAFLWKISISMEYTLTENGHLILRWFSVRFPLNLNFRKLELARYSILKVKYFKALHSTSEPSGTVEINLKSHIALLNYECPIVQSRFTLKY